MRKIKSSNIFMFLYEAYLINQVFSESQFNKITLIHTLLFATRYIILLGLVILIMIKNNTSSKNKLVLLVILTAFTILNMLIADGGLAMLPIILLVWNSKGYSIEKIFSTTIITLLLSHLFVMLCVLLGVIKDNIDYRYIGSYAGSFFSGQYRRHDMGFLVHNQIALMFLIIYLMIIAYKQDKIKWYESFVIMVLNYIIFHFFGSRTVFLLTTVVCIMYYVIRFIGSKKKKSSLKDGKGLLWIIYPFCTLISFVATLTYNPSSRISQILDLFFNNRLYLSKEAINFFGIGIIGAGKYAGTYNSVELVENTVDNGYISLFLQQGLIVAFVVIGIWCYLTYIAQKSGNKFLTLVFVVFAVENIVNTHLISYKMLPFFCILLNTKDKFIAGNLIWVNHKKKLFKMKIKFGRVR